MSDNRDQGNYYQQFSNAGNQPQDYQSSYNQNYQSPGIYQANSQNDYYNSYQNPAEHAHNLSISPSESNPTIGEKQQRIFSIFFWIILIWEGLVFGFLFLILFCPLVKFNESLDALMWFLHSLNHLLASIFCYKLIKGLQGNDVKPFTKGGWAFLGFFVFEWIYFIGWGMPILISAKYGLVFGIVFCITTVAVSVLAFMYIIWSCIQLEKLLGKNPIVSVA